MGSTWDFEQNDVGALMFILPPAILYLKWSGNGQQAIELFRFARQFPSFTENRWFLDICGADLMVSSAHQASLAVDAQSEMDRARLLKAKLKQLRAFLDAN